jgi:hypothetical protein
LSGAFRRDGWLGASRRNHAAITASKIMQPNDDISRKGQIGFVYRWCIRSHAECMSQATPMKRYAVSPRWAATLPSSANGSSYGPRPPLMYAPMAPPTNIAFAGGH